MIEDKVLKKIAENIEKLENRRVEAIRWEHPKGRRAVTAMEPRNGKGETLVVEVLRDEYKLIDRIIFDDPVLYKD